jgi:sugar O-acyltransferase (sialic acid O-acetyltransferase NeuD family)
MEKIRHILYGASGHAKVILDALENAGQKIDFLVDDNRQITELLGYEVQAPKKIQPKDRVLVSIGDNKTRQTVASQLTSTFFNSIHPSAVLSQHIKMGEGNTVMAGVLINPDTVIGNHCILNTGASIDHDCSIGDFVHISPQVTLCGNVIIGEGAHIGAAAVVLPGVKIGRWATVGAGAVVLKEVPEGTTVVGNPGTKLEGRN